MESEGLMSHSQGHSNNIYPEANHPNPLTWHNILKKSIY